MKTVCMICCALAAGIWAQTATAQGADQAIVLGKAAYNASCASCHGADGTGHGPTGESLMVAPIDLTALTRKSGGMFPFSEVYQMIDGRKVVRPHGTDSPMPVWGNYFMADSLADRSLSPEDATHVMQGRILSLVYYLQTIQQ